MLGFASMVTCAAARGMTTMTGHEKLVVGMTFLCTGSLSSALSCMWWRAADNFTWLCRSNYIGCVSAINHAPWCLHDERIKLVPRGRVNRLQQFFSCKNTLKIAKMSGTRQPVFTATMLKWHGLVFLECHHQTLFLRPRLFHSKSKFMGGLMGCL